MSPHLHHQDSTAGTPPTPRGTRRPLMRASAAHQRTTSAHGITAFHGVRADDSATSATSCELTHDNHEPDICQSTSSARAQRPALSSRMTPRPSGTPSRSTWNTTRDASSHREGLHMKNLLNGPQHHIAEAASLSRASPRGAHPRSTWNTTRDASNHREGLHMKNLLNGPQHHIAEAASLSRASPFSRFRVPRGTRLTPHQLLAATPHEAPSLNHIDHGPPPRCRTAGPWFTAPRERLPRSTWNTASSQLSFRRLALTAFPFHVEHDSRRTNDARPHPWRRRELTHHFSPRPRHVARDASSLFHVEHERACMRLRSIPVADLFL